MNDASPKVDWDHDETRDAPPASSVRHRSTGAARTLVRWSVAALTFLLTLELCIRAEDSLRWGAPFFGSYSHDGLFVADSLGWHPRPGAAYQKWTINEQGFRGPEVTRAKPDSVIRVAVLGSSETFGQAETLDHEFPRALERHLNSESDGGRRFEVLNAGIPGMSVARMAEYWDRWVASFDPDIVVVYPSPTFYLSNQVPPDSNSAAGISDPPSDSFRLRGKLRETLNRFLPESVESQMKKFLISREAARHGPGWVWERVPEERLQAYERHVRRLVTTLEEAGVRVIVATHVSVVDRPVDEQERIVLLAWRRFHPRATGDVLLDFESQANRRVAELGRELGFAVVDLRTAVPPDPANFSDQIHFTDAGAALVAGALADEILHPR